MVEIAFDAFLIVVNLKWLIQMISGANRFQGFGSQLGS